MVELHSTSTPHSWRQRLGRWLGFTPVPADVSDELAALRTVVADFGQAQAAGLATATALRETVERLERQLNRAGKEQFKANTLADAQQQTVKATLEQLRDAEAYRERELAALRERLTTARSDGRREIITHLFPVADGLSEAVASGERVLAAARRGATATPLSSEGEPGMAAAPLTWGQRVGRAWGRLRGDKGEPEYTQDATRTPSPGVPVSDLSADALAAWLNGLRFVQERLLDVLAADGVRPLETEGDLFDPHLHVVIETAPAADGIAPGTIVRELRRGYLAGDAVLRYAEVVVAR